MSSFSQTLPPAPQFTEANLPDQAGKVFIVTGAATGVGLELARMLHAKNGTVYIATRSSDKISVAVKNIQASNPASKGRLEPLVVDFSDLTTIRPAAREFLSKEPRLDLLVHNAGVMVPPAGSVGAQGHELQMATNALGPFLLTRCLEERLSATAASSAPGAVRVVWVSTLLSIRGAKAGVAWEGATAAAPRVHKAPMENYLQSKIGGGFLCHEFSQRLGSAGVISVSVNPGFTKTELQRHMPAPVRGMMSLVFKEPKFGAYSELFAAFSPDVTMEKNGSFVIPWGRLGSLPPALAEGISGKDKDGISSSQKFWAWCEKETSSFS